MNLGEIQFQLKIVDIEIKDAQEELIYFTRKKTELLKLLQKYKEDNKK